MASHENSSDASEGGGGSTRDVGPPAGSEEPKAPTGLIGRRFGHVQIVAELGRGGMGEVYVGVDEALQRRVAVKAIRSRWRWRAEAKERFLREARVLSQLDHPNICRIFDYVESESADLLILELVEGRPLHVAIESGLSDKEKLRIASQAAEALQAAHAEGIVHRDLKPSNVMLSRTGVVKILDFGLAMGTAKRPDLSGAETRRGSRRPRAEISASSPSLAEISALEDEVGTLAAIGSEQVTQLGAIVGSPLYMSPEQARGATVTTASDMYSFGLLLQTLFTERLPRPPGLSRLELVERARRGETRPLKGVDKTVAALIERLESIALASRPTARETAERLQWIRERPKRRLRNTLIATAVAALLFAGIRYTIDVTEARDIAQRRQQQAENLIGFMLGDLRDRLAEIDQLSVMAAVADRSLQYFIEVPEGELSDEELMRRSTALMHLAQVRAHEGDSEAALKTLEISLPMAAELANRQPGNVEWQRNLSEQHGWMARVHWNRGDLESSLDGFRSQLEAARRGLMAQPDNVDLKEMVAMSVNNLAFVEEARGDLEAALEGRLEFLHMTKSLAERDNGSWQRLGKIADAENALGVTLRRLGHLDEALQHLQKQRAILGGIAAPENFKGIQHTLGINRSLIGRIRLEQGETEQALVHFREALAMATERLESDRTNANLHRELGIAETLIGEALLYADPLGAERHFGSALPVFQSLFEKDSASIRARRDLARAQSGLARAKLRSERPDEANEAILAAREILDGVAGSDASGGLQSLQLLSEIYLLEGDIAAARGKLETASRAWARGLEIIEPTARSTSDADVAKTWLRALDRNGREEAETVRRRLTALSYDLSQISRPASKVRGRQQ